MNAIEFFIMGMIIGISFMAGYLPKTTPIKLFFLIGSFFFAILVALTSKVATSTLITFLTSIGLFSGPLFVGLYINKKN